MKITVEKSHLMGGGGQILYRSFEPSKKRRQSFGNLLVREMLVKNLNLSQSSTFRILFRNMKK